MEQPKPNLWKEYVGFLWISYLIAGASILLFRTAASLGVLFAIFLFSGFLFGSLFFCVGHFVPKARFRSFWLTILVRSLLIVAVILLGMVLVVPVAIALSNRASLLSRDVWAATLSMAKLKLPEWIGIGFGLSVVINSLFGIDRKLGPGVLWKWITGRYHNPKEEERIFMFLDLKNSTTLAEKLGNVRFSRLCQDFFRDLSRPVEGTKGEVSHYIGDEAVLCWKPNAGLENANCIRCFFYMRSAILKRADHYRKEYGIVPEFKAGVHIGLVVAAEVGEIKSEIVYHGDVLNTTARITGLCSELGSDLLISGDLRDRLSLPDQLQARSFGPRLLKGKEHEVEIVAIAPAVPVAEPEPAPV